MRPARNYPTRSENTVSRTTAMRDAFIRAGVRVKGRVGTYTLPAWQLIFGGRR